jgi:ubiquinone/menaquinone biosynthesis C-methylase UbiE
MGLYSNVIFPRFYDFIVDRPNWAKHRKEQLASVRGEILEIGAGTGLNLPHYPRSVRKITTAEPNPGMNRRLRRRIDATGIEVDKQVVRCESLPFDEATFDCVVSTLTLCSIADVRQAMREVFRVLKPGGRMVFLEHGISPDRNVAKWQRRLNWLEKRLAGGCILTLDVPAILATQPFRTVAIDTFQMDNTPKTHGSMYRGSATK